MILQNSIEKIKSEFSHHVLEESEFAGDTSLHINGEKVLDILKLLKNEGFNFLSDLTAVDNLDIGRHERFAVVYHLLSHESAERLTVKAYISEDNLKLQSVESLWKTADWQEREVFDLYGIEFEGHPNLIRILNPEDYKGYPLRKDYSRVGRGERRDFNIVKRRVGSKFE
tara:strand:- start:10029 stop:10538 length:510 start_codon:yes stop_codon:yes gene_type:complete